MEWGQVVAIIGGHELLKRKEGGGGGVSDGCNNW